MFINPISYPGNKNKLLSQIIPLFPKNIINFVDVFCGSGVIGVNTNAKNIILNDYLKEAVDIIIFFYKNNFKYIVDSIETIINSYNLTYSRIKPKGTYIEYKHEGLSKYNKIPFQKLKSDYNKNPTTEKLVVLLIYSFNHYIRFNKNGQFNVPVGKVDFSESIYKALQLFITNIQDKNIIFYNKDFRDKILYNYSDSFYYFDPPYLITTAPYNTNWKEKDEIDLLNIIDELHLYNKQFALSNVLLSNGKQNFLLKNWATKKYNIHYLKRQYKNANYQKNNITDSIEVLITNY